MLAIWPLMEAKNKLSEVINLALSQGPQRIRRRRDEVVLISARDFDKLTGKSKDLKSWLLDAPKIDGLELPERSGTMRETQF